MNECENGPVREVWLIEDNLADSFLFETLLGDKLKNGKLRVWRDGIEAISELAKRSKQVEPSLPKLILLDLNLPRMDGRELLKAIKSDQALMKIPIIILSTSSADRDISDTYALGANAFLSKPLDLDGLDTMITRLRLFWLDCALLP